MFNRFRSLLNIVDVDDRAVLQMKEFRVRQAAAKAIAESNNQFQDRINSLMVGMEVMRKELEEMSVNLKAGIDESAP